MSIVSNNIRAKTANAVTFNDNVIINGSLKFTTKIYAEFYLSASSATGFSAELTVPFNITRYNTGSFTLDLGEIIFNTSMLISVSSKITGDIVTGGTGTTLNVSYNFTMLMWVQVL